MPIITIVCPICAFLLYKSPNAAILAFCLQKGANTADNGGNEYPTKLHENSFYM